LGLTLSFCSFIIPHFGGFVKRFSKLFFGARPVSVLLPSTDKHIISYKRRKRNWQNAQGSSFFRVGFCAKRRRARAKTSICPGKKTLARQLTRVVFFNKFLQFAPRALRKNKNATFSVSFAQTKKHIE
jgi:hypothetical protein